MKNLLFVLTVLVLLSCNGLPEEIPYEGPDIEFAIIGDYGDYTGSVGEVADLVKSWEPEFIITVGDNNYPDGEYSTLNLNISDHYCNYIYNPDAPDSLRCDGTASETQENAFFPSIGNHDYEGPDGIQPYLDYFTLPEEEINYDFVKGPIHFFVLDSCSDSLGVAYSPDIEQWLKDKISTSTAPFKICYMHHPPYSYAKHGSTPRVQFDFEDLGIDIVITGHNHVYERLTPHESDNFHYIINGLGGRKFIDICDDLPVDRDLFARFCFDQSHGAISAVANGDSLSLRFYPLQGSDPIDEVIIY